MIAVVRDPPRHSGIQHPDTGAGSAGPAWIAVVALLLALVGLAGLLPAPTDLMTVSGQGAAAVDAVVLAGTAVLVWALAAWVAVVAAVAAFGVLPGAVGRQARRVLRLIAPRLALRLVAVAVGASALAGTTACSAPIFASTTASESASVPATTPSPQVFDPAGATTSTSPARTGPTGPDGGPALVIDIDWPSSASATAEPPAPGPAGTTAVGSPATTSAAAASSPTVPSSSPTATSTRVTPPATGATGPATGPAPVDPGPADGGGGPTSTPAGTSASGSSTGSPASGGAASASARPSGEAIVVLPGDTLWALAADALPAGADDAAVDAAWRQWYALNRDVIGDDPDLLQPGEHLIPPPADPPTVEENDR